jgi:hypothetical protein
MSACTRGRSAPGLDAIGIGEAQEDRLKLVLDSQLGGQDNLGVGADGMPPAFASFETHRL